MPEGTVRTRSQLNNDFADNSSGDIGAGDLRNLIASVKLTAELGSAALAETTAFDAAGASAAVQTNLTTHANLTTTAHGGLVASNDSRLTNARTPTAHASSHATGQSDAIAPADIGAAPLSHAHNSIATYTGADPNPLSDGMIWFRTDLFEFRVRANGTTYRLTVSPVT